MNFLDRQKTYWERDALDKRRSPNHPVVAEYVNRKISRIRQVVEINEASTLLDVGCGNGFFSYHFDKICDTTGVDYSETLLSRLSIEKKHLMDAQDLKFDDNSFDVVFCHALLHHVENVERVIHEMVRVSRRYVVIIEPNRNNPLMFLFTAIVPEEWKALRFSLSYLKREVKQHPVKILDSFSFGMIVPNKTPAFLLPFLRPFEFKQPLGMTSFVIAEKLNTLENE